MLWFVQVGFLSLLALAAWFDWKTREIPDPVLIAAWLAAALFFAAESALTVAVFALIYCFSWVSRVTLKAEMGWGDMLLLPPACAFARVLGGDIGLGFVFGAWVISAFVAPWFKNRTPFAVVLYLLLMVSLAFV